MKKLILLALVLNMTSLFNDSLASNADDLFNSKTLWVYENESVTLKAGYHSFNKIVLENNATVLLEGTTSIYTKKIRSTGTSRFKYVPGSDIDTKNKRFTLLATDGSKINGELQLIGDGADGAKGSTGHTGATGLDESCKLFKGCRSSTKGQNGGTGSRGQDGENGMDIYVSINQIN